MIQLQAIGNLGSDATMKEAGGKKVINFSIAVTEKYKDRNQVKKERTTWISCSLWDQDAVAPFLKKGAKVYVQGNPGINTYTSGQQMDQTTKAEQTLNVYQLELLSPKKED